MGFELGMTLDYASDWGFVEAVREFFQNCLDANIQDATNKWSVHYDPEMQVLQIGNKYGHLEPKTLLLGCSSKRGDVTTLGEHGEGYKVAMVVLTRLNYHVRVFNYEIGQIWDVSNSYSDKYKTDIVVVEVTEIDAADDKELNLIYEVSGVTEDMYNLLVQKNLWLRDSYGHYDGLFGQCLTDREEQGNIYINGLFVEHRGENLARYGWNFKPGVIHLDRDRNTLDSFDIIKTCSTLAQYFSADEINVVKDAPECKWLMSYLVEDAEEKQPEEEELPEEEVEEPKETQKVKMQKVYDDSYAKFKEEYGSDAVPVKDDVEFNRYARAGKTCVKLEDNEYQMVTSASDYKPVKLVSEDAESPEILLKEIRDWYESYNWSILDKAARDAIYEIMTKVRRVIKDE